MSEEVLKSLRIDGSRVRLPSPTERFVGWQFFAGTNTITKKTDVFVAIPTGRNEWEVYRFSGKNEDWNHNCSLTDGRPPLRYLQGYGKVKEVKAVEPLNKPDQQVAKVAKPTEKGTGTLMSSLKKVFGRFGKTEKGAYAMSVEGGVAIRRGDGTYACLREGNLVNMDTFALDIDAFYYVPAPVGTLKANDVVVVGNGVGFVREVANGEIKVYDVNNEAFTTIKPATHFIMKEPFVTKVVSLFALGGEGALGGMNPLLLMTLFDKGLEGGGDKKNLLLMLMLSQGGGLGANPLLLMMLLGEGGLGGKDDLLPLMLMGGMGGGAGLGNLFGGGCCKGPAKAEPVVG